MWHSLVWAGKTALKTFVMAKKEKPKVEDVKIKPIPYKPIFRT